MASTIGTPFIAFNPSPPSSVNQQQQTKTFPPPSLYPFVVQQQSNGMASSFVPPKLYPTAFIDQAMFVTISEDNHHNDTIAKRTTPSGQHHKQPQPPQHNHHYSQQQHQRDKQKAQYSESDSEEEESEEGEHVFLPVSPKQLAEAHHQQQHVNHNKNEEYVNLFWNPPAELSLYEMRKKLQINCLVGADFEEYELCNGVKWMVCVDRTSASKRAFKTVLKQAAKEDFVFIVHMRGVPLYIEGTPYDSEEEEVKLHYTIWREAVLYMHLYKKEIEKSRPDLRYEIFIPVANDPRKMAVKTAKKYRIQHIVIGKHSAEDKSTRSKNFRFRAFSSYVSKKASKHGIIVSAV